MSWKTYLRLNAFLLAGCLRMSTAVMFGEWMGGEELSCSAFEHSVDGSTIFAVNTGEHTKMVRYKDHACRAAVTNGIVLTQDSVTEAWNKNEIEVPTGKYRLRNIKIVNMRTVLASGGGVEIAGDGEWRSVEVCRVLLPEHHAIVSANCTFEASDQGFGGSDACFMQLKLVPRETVRPPRSILETRVYAKYTGYRDKPDGGVWFGATI